MENNIALYIDDERVPKTNRNWEVVRNAAEARKYMNENGCPSYISFDHDLGDFETGYDIAKWIVEKDMERDGKFIPENFEFNVHSANPVGAANIEKYLINYLTFR